MIRGYFYNTNKVVTLWSKAIIILFVGIAVVWTEYVGKVFDVMRSWIMLNFNGLYIYSVAFILIFMLILAISPYGKIPLGKDGEKPEFKYWSWIAMLFSTGLAVGLVFWSIAEPMLHYEVNPFLASGKEGSLEAARMAIQVTFFHWGLHPWAIYGLVGLSLSYISYRKGLPLTIRYSVYPLLGAKTNSIFGYLIDIFAIFIAVFGVATSLGYGVQQIAKGLYFLTDIEFFKSQYSVYGLTVCILFVSIFLQFQV